MDKLKMSKIRETMIKIKKLEYPKNWNILRILEYPKNWNILGILEYPIGIFHES